MAINIISNLCLFTLFSKFHLDLFLSTEPNSVPIRRGVGTPEALTRAWNNSLTGDGQRFSSMGLLHMRTVTFTSRSPCTGPPKVHFDGSNKSVRSDYIDRIDRDAGFVGRPICRLRE